MNERERESLHLALQREFAAITDKLTTADETEKRRLIARARELTTLVERLLSERPGRRDQTAAS